MEINGKKWCEYLKGFFFSVYGGIIAGLFVGVAVSFSFNLSFHFMLYFVILELTIMIPGGLLGYFFYRRLC
jgi:hypothetical protein